MAAIQINRTVDLSKMVQPEALTGVTFTEESGGHEFVLTAKDAVLSGTIKARFMRGDGSTTEFFGSTVDGVAHLTLTADCYEVAGRFLLTVFYDGGDGMAVIYAAVGHVVKSSNGAVTPSQPAAQSFEDILAGYVQQMTSATNAANTAASAASEAATDAEAAAASSVRYDVSQSLTEVQQEQARENIGVVDKGLSDAAKTALLDCFAHVAWIDEHGQAYYNALRSALYAESYPKLTAVYNPGLHVVYTDDALDTLKPYLTVTYYETAESTGAVVAANDYTLSGTLAVGQSSIIAQYNTVADAFNVEAIDFYNIWNWSLGNNTLMKVSGGADPNQSDTAMYPSRATFNPAQSATRRSFVVSRGKAPYYERNQTAVATAYYPIPIPDEANHIKIHIDNGRYIYAHIIPYDEATNTYGNTETSARIQWTQDTGTGVETTLPYKSNNWFLLVNSKYDSAGASYPVEPTTFTVEFSEV